MSDAHHENWGGNIRKLWPTETDSFRDHLLRLDRETRRLRFAHIASDSFIQQYAAHMLDMGSVACLSASVRLNRGHLRMLGIGVCLE